LRVIEMLNYIINLFKVKKISIIIFLLLNIIVLFLMISQIFQKFSGKYKYVLLPELLYSEPYRIDSKGQQIQISQ